MKHRRFFFLFSIFSLPLLFSLAQCYKTEAKDPRGKRYAGMASCMRCHQQIYSSYLHSAHLKTSRLATLSAVQGSFLAGRNAFVYSKNVKVMMQHLGSAFYQQEYIGGKLIQSHRFDLVMGFAEGETYLYWKGNNLYQLPVSYLKANNSWVSSPGYEESYPDFGRPVLKRCFECHSSFAKEVTESSSTSKNEPGLDRQTLMLGIDCERCHGPGAEHVAYQTRFPEEKKSKYMVAYQSLSKAQKIDACGVCHSGNQNFMLHSTFSFKPGDNLDDYQQTEYTGSSTAESDVHGNQKQLLSESKCFIKGQLTCTTCHGVHQSERLSAAAFSQKCQICHTEANHNFCKLPAVAKGKLITQKCIDCHMPSMPSGTIVMRTSGNKTEIHYQVRTHNIKIYPQETQKVLAWLKKSQY